MSKSDAIDVDVQHALASAMTKTLTPILDALQRRLQTVEAELAATKADLGDLRAKGLLQYCGVWQESASYARGACVTFGGSMWVATTAPMKGAKPGGPLPTDRAWQLAVKKGAEGKEGRPG